MITPDTTLEELADAIRDADALAAGIEGPIVGYAADHLKDNLSGFNIRCGDELNDLLVTVMQARGYLAWQRTERTPDDVVDLILRRLNELADVDDLIGNAHDSPWDGEFHSIADLFGFFGVDADLLPDLLADISDEQVQFIVTGQTLIEVLITATLPTRFGHTPTHTRREIIGWR